MGYCPQTDALIPSLNAFDHLRLFARLRGIPKSNVELEVNKWINRLSESSVMIICNFLKASFMGKHPLWESARYDGIYIYIYIYIFQT